MNNKQTILLFLKSINPYIIYLYIFTDGDVIEYIHFFQNSAIHAAISLIGLSLENYGNTKNIYPIYFFY